MPHDDYIALESIRAALPPERWAAHLALGQRMAANPDDHMGETLAKAVSPFFSDINDFARVSDSSLAEMWSDP
jgi:hypothetical protein